MKIIQRGTSEPITIEQARKWCKLDASGSPPTHEDDDILEDIIIPGAREWCEAYLGMIIAPSIVEIRLSAFPTAEITLESSPVIGPVIINYRDALGAPQTFDETLYELDTTSQVAVARLRSGASWPTTDASNDNITVQYSVGYSAAGDSPQDAPLPRSITLAMALLTAHLYKNRESTVETALAEMPMGVKFFLSPLKVRRGFA